MSIHFQPKIIIGSVIGFIASVLGIIVAFFPSVFNLEKKSIAEYTYNLNTENDAEKFIQFLKNHQNSIVHLNISYIENERYIDLVDKNGNIILDDNAEMDGTPAKDDLNKKCMESIVDDDDGLGGKDSYGLVDPEGRIFIRSEFKCKRFLNDFNFLRTNGGIGIWFPNETDSSKDITYRIIITGDSNKNSLYKWSIKNRENNVKEMQIEGTFFVNDFIDAHNSDHKSIENIKSMSPQWGDYYNGMEQIGIDGIEIIELQPLSKKEIESKNY